ncbi:hypothetical protein BHE74_00022929 [Ensete ventricosum]|nr:hypothetical protein BHE74_00022929 [Ensete ventricosum]
MSQKLSIAQRNSASDPPPSTQERGREKETRRRDEERRGGREGRFCAMGKRSVFILGGASASARHLMRNMKGEEKEGYRIFGTSRLFHDRTLRSNREGPSATVGAVPALAPWKVFEIDLVYSPELLHSALSKVSDVNDDEKNNNIGMATG